MANKKFGFSLVKSPSWDAEIKKLKATPEAIQEAIKDELIVMATRIRNHIVRSMESTPRITRTKNMGNSNANNPSGNFNWMSGGKLHIPSSPGYAPAVDKKGLKESILMDVRVGEVEIGSNLTGKKGKYPTFLEFGTKNMDARPWLEPAFIDEKRVFFATIRNNILRSIKNPK